MISLKDAFGSHTTTKVEVRIEIPGHYDDDNRWVESTYSAPIMVAATPIPLGDPEHREYGISLVPDQTGERTPAAIKIASRWRMPINSLLIYGDHQYKIIREGDYHAAGFWFAVGVSDTTAYPITQAIYPRDMMVTIGHKQVPMAQAARVRYSGK